MRRDGVVVLHLLRHAHAGDAADWAGPDTTRPLTDKGERQAERLGRFLAAQRVRPSAILTSPLVRARRTAELVAAPLGLVVREDPRLADRLGIATVEAMLRDAGDAPMLVGHEPDLSALVGLLVDAGHVPMRKGALATIDAEMPLGRGTGSLRWLLPPELLAQD